MADGHTKAVTSEARTNSQHTKGNRVEPPHWDEPFGSVVDRDVIVAGGADVASYLQGQLTQDVVGLDVGQVAWSLILKPQGKVSSWFRVTRASADTYELDLTAGDGVDALHRLEQFKLRVDVQFDLQTVPMVAVRGGEVPGGRPVGWVHGRGTDLIGHATVPSGVRLAEPDELEVWRIAAGMPRIGAELTEDTIPAEVPGLVPASVSFDKGCYVGQELVARIDSRGASTPRTVRRFVASAPVNVGDRVVVGGDEVGAVTSAAAYPGGSVALASVKRSADLSASFSIGDGPALLIDRPQSD